MKNENSLCMEEIEFEGTNGGDIKTEGCSLLLRPAFSGFIFIVKKLGGSDSEMTTSFVIVLMMFVPH